ncbi:pyruvate kinase alpha/beta domain-containing protein [Pseudomonadota bacterium]
MFPLDVIWRYFTPEMARIIQHPACPVAFTPLGYGVLLQYPPRLPTLPITQWDSSARYVITFTGSGTTARLVSHFRPNCHILMKVHSF